MFDIRINGGDILDGSGKPSFKADIGISNSQISAIGSLEETARFIIDARGLCVSPGFIDMHSHSDFSLFVNPRAESKIRQGVTTEVIGNCGGSAAPVLKERLDLIREKRFADEGMKIDWNWLTMADYLDRIRKQGIAVNIVPLIGHNTIRAAVMGYEQRAPDENELARMKDLIRDAMDQGARGLSTGLIYAPGCYARTDELVALAGVVREKNGFYASHIRNENDHLIAAVEEAISIGRKAGIPVQLSHHKAIGKSNWGKVTASLALMDEANRSGLDVTADQYPYRATSTGLTSILPHWMLRGSLSDLLARLANPGVRQRLNEEICVRDGYFEETYLSSCRHHPELEGKSLNALAEIHETDPLTAVLDLLIQEQTHVEIVSFGMSEQDVRRVMCHPRVMFGSDGKILADYGILHRGKPHPRHYGTFPRIIGKYVREEKVLPLEEAIRKMTSLPADRLGLSDRGRIGRGQQADLVIFNMGTIRDAASFSDPHHYPVGIAHVLVNGQMVIQEGDHTNRLPGTVL